MRQSPPFDITARDFPLTAMGFAFGLLLLSSSAKTWGQTYTVLHSFAGGSSDGSNPYGSLVQSGSVLYGFTDSGGKAGTIFGFDTSTNTLNLLYSFQGFLDGAGTSGSPTQSGSLLYGLNSSGADFGGSAIFSYDTGTNTHKVLYDFNSDGAVSYGSLLQSGSMLYGMSNHANNGSPFGTLFSFNTVSNMETTLHSFAGNGDGAYPEYGRLVESGSVLYGATSQGGEFGAGTIFSFDTGTNTETILHSFNASASNNFAEPEGVFPYGGLLKSGNILYGLTSQAGPNGAGTLYGFDLTSNTLTVLHAFGSGVDDGAMPFGSLIESGSVLYGMTSQGGSSNDGTIFAFDTSTNTFALLHSFDSADGLNPHGDLLLSGNTLYGMTLDGGMYNDGVIFAQAVPESGGLYLLVGGGLMFGCRRNRKRA